jgi:hypothetical protein
MKPFVYPGMILTITQLTPPRLTTHISRYMNNHNHSFVRMLASDECKKVIAPKLDMLRLKVDAYSCLHTRADSHPESASSYTLCKGRVNATRTNDLSVFRRPKACRKRRRDDEEVKNKDNPMAKNQTAPKRVLSACMRANSTPSVCSGVRTSWLSCRRYCVSSKAPGAADS